MSLKAKLEAVIYAAEEPVTLNQLAALFAADALEWKAQQEAAAAEQTAEVAGVSPDAIRILPLIEQMAEPPDAPEAGSHPDASAAWGWGVDAELEPGAPAESEAPASQEVVSVS